MSKKNLYIILGIIVVLFLGLMLAFFIITQKGATNNGTPSNPFANFFPFGNPPPSNTQTPPNGSNTNPGGNELFTTPTTNPLRQITTTPTAGYYASVRQGNTYVSYVQKETGNIYET